MVKINPVLRKDKAKEGNKEVPIYLFVYYKGKKIKSHPTGLSIEPKHWNEEERCVRRSFVTMRLYNNTIERQVAELKEQFIQGAFDHKVKDAVEVMKKEKAKDICFHEFAEKQIKEKDYEEETRRKYTTVHGNLKKYRPKLKISDIDFLFLQGWEHELRKLGKHHNTIVGELKFIQMILNDAMKAKILPKDKDPFKEYKRPNYKRTKRTFLESDEIAKIEAFVAATEDENLWLIGNYFLFMSYTGLRYSDASRFDPSIHVIENGKRIFMETKKYKKLADLYINDKIRPVIDFCSKNKLYMTPQDFNRKLKLIAARCGIDKKVTSHVGRHSFGSALADRGIPIEIAQQLLSHSDKKTTEIYYHVKRGNMDEAMKRFNDN